MLRSNSMGFELGYLKGLLIIGFLLTGCLLLIPRPQCAYTEGEGKSSVTRASFDADFCLREKRRLQDANGS